MRMSKGEPFMHIEADSMNAPTFSERFLYETVGKGDARFILGIAEEYEHVIDALGPKAIKRLLAIRPRLVNRLGTGEKLCEWLEDAVDEETLRHEERFPPQVILSERLMDGVWNILHNEYSRYYVPEEDMDKETLAVYLALTEAMGPHERERHAEVAKEKAETGEAKRAEAAEQVAQKRAERQRQHERRDARERVVETLRKIAQDDVADARVRVEAREALEQYDAAWGVAADA